MRRRPRRHRRDGRRDRGASLPAALELGLSDSTASSASSCMPMPSSRGARSSTTTASSMPSTRSQRRGDERRPVMLAWRDVDEAGETAIDGYRGRPRVRPCHRHARRLTPASTRSIRPPSTADGRTRSPTSRGLRGPHRRGRGSFLDPYAQRRSRILRCRVQPFFVAPPTLRTREPRTYASLPPRPPAVPTLALET